MKSGGGSKEGVEGGSGVGTGGRGNPYYLTMMYLVMDRFEELLETFVARLEVGGMDALKTK
jgi:hypothetical protein